MFQLPSQDAATRNSVFRSMEIGVLSCTNMKVETFVADGLKGEAHTCRLLDLGERCSCYREDLRSILPISFQRPAYSTVWQPDTSDAQPVEH